jgi:hypothetical protein
MAQAGLRRGAARTAAIIALAALGGAAASPSLAALPPLRVFPGSLLLPPPTARPTLPDTCGAAALAGLIGRPRTQIPVPTDLSRRRVACTACPVAPDVRLDRVNILYDLQTGRVAKITCG